MVTPRVLAGTLTDALTASVGFVAVADVRPTRETQGGRCRQREASEHDSWGKAIMKWVVGRVLE